MSDEQRQLLALIREFYGRVVWTHKTYEKDREISTFKSWRDKWINVGLMAVTTTGVLASIPLGTSTTTIIAALFSFVSTGFAIYQTSFAPELEIQQFRTAAKDLLVERDRLTILIHEAMLPSADLNATRAQFNEIMKRVHQIYSVSPDTSSAAFQKASKGLKQTEEFFFTDDELDTLLPPALRLKKPTP